MGLFSKKKPREPVVHPDVVRRVHVAAPGDAVRRQLAAYDALGGGGTAVDLQLVEADGWTTVVIATPVHPWAFHNLAMWLLDTDGGVDVLAVADPGDGHHGYWLRDDSHDSWLSGYDDTGASLTVSVPMNQVVLGDALDHPAATRAQALTAAGVPAPLHAATTGSPATVALEDPGHDCNPTMAASAPTRSRLARADTDFTF